MFNDLEEAFELLVRNLSVEERNANPSFKLRFARIKKILTDLRELEEYEPYMSELA